MLSLPTSISLTFIINPTVNIAIWLHHTLSKYRIITLKINPSALYQIVVHKLIRQYFETIRLQISLHCHLQIFILILFYFSLKWGSNGIRRFKIVFQRLIAVWEHKKRRLPANIKSAESLYLSLFLHILHRRIVSKCGFTYLQRNVSAPHKDLPWCQHTAESGAFGS